uniref:Uncharacterized protein LOC111103737 n=1 Tax=Crassostrea virginica TaxID=6565 RepID=A0A8B8AMX5_CRAVI|nr:uncharacterized protein LOC111103737 [Crassostrea virginica]
MAIWIYWLNLIPFYVFLFQSAKTCTNSLGLCCEHYMLIGNKCKPCPPGFTDDVCKKHCPPPSYGERCKYSCGSCSPCHHVYGCPLYSNSSFTLETESVSSPGTTFASGESALSTPKFPKKKKHLLIAFFSLSCLVILGFLILLKIHLTKHCQKRIILSV